MTFLFRVAEFLRGGHGRDEREALALVDHRRAEEDSRAAEEGAGAAKHMRSVERDPRSIVVGSSFDPSGRPFAVRLSEREARLGGHCVVNGSTGSGKSFWILSQLAQLLRQRRRGVVICDMKGELASLVREVLLPSIAASLPEAERDDLLRRIAVIAPFDDSATPPFQVLSRDTSLPIEVQAHEVASSFGRTLGKDLGVIQSNVLRMALILLIDQGLTLPDLPRVLEDGALLRALATRTRVPEVRAYFLERFPRERAASVGALLTRLDTIVMYPGLKRMLMAPGCVRFERLLEDAITIIHLGGSPAGLRDVARFFAMLTFGRIQRAIFARRVTEHSPPVRIIADEFQEMLSPDVADDFERVLTLARSQKAFLTVLFQQAASVEKVSSTLLRVIKTNSNYHVAFRANDEDVRAMSHVLPVTGRVPRETSGFPDPRTPPTFLTPEEERRRLIEQTVRMPDRLFWFLDRQAAHGAVLTRSPTISIDAMKAQAATLPEEIRTLIRRGVLALSREEIEAAVRARQERLEGALREEAEHAPVFEPRDEIHRDTPAWSDEEVPPSPVPSPRAVSRPKGRSRGRTRPPLG